MRRLSAALIGAVFMFTSGVTAGYAIYHPQPPKYGCSVSLSPAHPIVDAHLIGVCKITIRAAP